MKTRKLNSTAEKLLKTAERLYARHGIEAISTRQISREAGQKNHSALQYHFGTKEGLIEAILVYRMGAINTKRLALIREFEEQGRLNDIRSLVELLIRPFALELLKPADESYYISLLAELYRCNPKRVVYQEGQQYFSSVQFVGGRLMALIPTDRDLANDRMRFLGAQIVHTLDDWDQLRRSGQLLLDAELLHRKVGNLIDFLVGGLTASVSITESREALVPA